MFRGLLKLKNLTKVQLFSSSQLSSHRPIPENSESVPFDFTPENYVQISRILNKYPSNYKRSAVIPLLTMAQKQNNNFLSLSAMKKIGKILEITEMDVYEVKIDDNLSFK